VSSRTARAIQRNPVSKNQKKKKKKKDSQYSTFTVLFYKPTYRRWSQVLAGAVKVLGSLLSSSNFFFFFLNECAW
jgi:hypothetical protein